MRAYWITWAVLLVFTLLMLWADDASPVIPRTAFVMFMVAAMLGKVSLIGANFMHLRFERATLVLTVVVGLLVTATVFLVRPDQAGRGTHPHDGDLAMNLRRSGVWVVLACGLMASQETSAQCAMCRRALQSPEGQQMIAAFRNGIVLLLAAPFASFAAVALLVLRMQRCRATPESSSQND